MQLAVALVQVASFLRRSTGQYLVISLKEQLYSQASAVLGIYSKVGTVWLSRVDYAIVHEGSSPEGYFTRSALVLQSTEPVTCK